MDDINTNVTNASNYEMNSVTIRRNLYHDSPSYRQPECNGDIDAGSNDPLARLSQVSGSSEDVRMDFRGARRDNVAIGTIPVSAESDCEAKIPKGIRTFCIGSIC